MKTSVPAGICVAVLITTGGCRMVRTERCEAETRCLDAEPVLGTDAETKPLPSSAIPGMAAEKKPAAATVSGSATAVSPDSDVKK